jgi:hypothetical protein
MIGSKQMIGSKRHPYKDFIILEQGNEVPQVWYEVKIFHPAGDYRCDAASVQDAKAKIDARAPELAPKPKPGSNANEVDRTRYTDHINELE